MKNERIKEITSKAVEQLVAALNEGRSETLTAYLSAMAKFHRYSVRNIVLIAMQKPTATHVAGFHAKVMVRVETTGVVKATRGVR